MTDRLTDLLHAEADALEIPYAPLDEILHAGRRCRRRRVVPVLASVAAAVVVGSLVVFTSLGIDSDRGDGSVARHIRSQAVFTDAQVQAVQRAYGRGGAFAVGSKVYFGDFDQGVEIHDRAVRGLYYTSAGVLVRHGRDYAMDGSSRDGYSLVALDGSVTGLDLRIGDVSPSTEPTQPYFVYARPRTDDWEVVVLDLRSGKSAAIVPLEGSFTWGGWKAPPVALSGDRVYVGLDDAIVAVDWRTGEVTPTPLPPSSYPDINAERYVQIQHKIPAGGSPNTSVRVRDARSGDTVLDLPGVGDRWASLSPDGRHLLVLPSMLVEDGQIQRLDDAELYTVDTGERRALPASPQGGYGWTPDGLVMSLTRDALTLCDADKCTISQLKPGVVTDTATLRLGGIVNES